MNPYFGEIYHYGIKGQKWGVRRYQNADMTWTEAGKERYGRNGTLVKARLEKAAAESSKVAKSGALENYQKKQLKKMVNIDDETLKNTKYSDLVKDVNNAKYVPKHDYNSNREAKAFIASLAMDTFVPGMQVYLPFDLYRGGKALSSHIKSKKYENERSNEKIDKETGFHLKSEEVKNLSEKDDLKRVNPDFNDFNSNSKSNCVLCTMTCEMRDRGYDVTANKAGVGYFDNEIEKMFKNYKTEKISVANYRQNMKQKDNYDRGANQYSGGGMDFARRTIESIEKSQPNGARGNLSVVWGGAFGGGGHSMYYKIKNNKLVVYDGQSGKIYSNPEKILKMCTSVDIGRLDNLKFNKDGIKEACR